MYILGCGASGREFPVSEDQKREPDRALRLSAWLPGTYFTESHPEVGQELNDENLCSTTLRDKKVTHTANSVQRWLRVSARAGKNQPPGSQS